MATAETSIEDVTGNDNSYGTFERAVVATVKDKLYPTIEHCWFSRKNQGTDGSIVSGSGGAPYKMTAGRKFKLARTNGMVSAFHYDNGGWVPIGASQELGDAMKTAPLKIGLRIKREWKSEYYIKVLPTIVSSA